MAQIGGPGCGISHNFTKIFDSGEIFRRIHTTPVCTDTYLGDILGLQPQDVMHHLAQPGQVENV